MSFKLLRGNSDSLFLEPIQQLTLRRFELNNVEFCFQFEDEDPVVFANGPNQCNITLSPTPDGNITFTNNGKVFKLFARERLND